RSRWILRPTGGLLVRARYSKSGPTVQPFASLFGAKSAPTGAMGELRGRGLGRVSGGGGARGRGRRDRRRARGGGGAWPRGGGGRGPPPVPRHRRRPARGRRLRR